jgi:hypothetical protein
MLSAREATVSVTSVHFGRQNADFRFSGALIPEAAGRQLLESALLGGRVGIAEQPGRQVELDVLDVEYGHRDVAEVVTSFVADDLSVEFDVDEHLERVGARLGVGGAVLVQERHFEALDAEAGRRGREQAPTRARAVRVFCDEPETVQRARRKARDPGAHRNRFAARGDLRRRLFARDAL